MPKAKMKRKGAPASAIADLALSGLPVRFETNIRNKQTKIKRQTNNQTKIVGQTNKQGRACVGHCRFGFVWFAGEISKQNKDNRTIKQR